MTPPLTIAGYEIVRLLGKGGMGAVFLACRAGETVPVAFKLVNPANPNDRREYGLRFEREVRIASQLNHPRLVRVLGHGCADGQRYLVMEYVPGVNLRSFLEESQPLAIERIRAVARGIAEALAYLEDESVIHRDLKPENVLLDETGNVRLTDFGLCTRVEEIGALTASSQTVGTFEYMAPEQRSRLPIDARADQYALAVVVYEMLTGKRPAGRFKPPSVLNRRISHAADAVVMRALQEDPDDRYPHIRDFAGALDRALAARVPRRYRLFVPAAVLLLLPGASFNWSLWPSRAGAEAALENRNGAVSAAHAEPAPPSPSRAEDVRRLTALAEQHGRAHLRELAIRCLSEAIGLAPEDPLLLVKRAASYQLYGQGTEALRDLDAALKLNPRLAAAYTCRADISLARGKLDDAASDLEQALQLDPNDALAHAHRGRLHRRRAARDAAIEDLTRAIQLDANCGLAFFHRGLVLQEKKNYSEALADLRRSADLTPDNPFAHAALAHLLSICSDEKLRDGPLAVQHARQACELTKWREAQMLRHLAAAYAAADEPLQAIHWCDKALERPCSDKERRMIQGLLGRVRKAQQMSGGTSP